jgi:hypothetical protein
MGRATLALAHLRCRGGAFALGAFGVGDPVANIVRTLYLSIDAAGQVHGDEQ